MLRRIFLAATFLCSFIGRGQFSIGIDTASFTYTFQDTVTYSNASNWAVQVTLQNFGSTINSTDTIGVYAAVDSGNVIPNYKQFYSGFTGGVTMNNGDTLPNNFSDTILPNAFRSGINTVVIWPKVNNNISSTFDSLFIKVFVDTNGWSTIGIQKIRNNQGFIMYPNPSTDAIYFKAFSNDNPYRKIKIYDMEGRLVASSDFSKRVDVSFLKPGIYMVAVETLSGDQKKIRFLKE